MSVEFLSLADCRIAYQRQVGDKNNPGIIFLGGYASDMTGSKASWLAERCEQEKLDFIRFDYSGCGQSSGDFRDGTIGNWRRDSLAVFDQLTRGPQIVIGSSMGGWLALLLAEARQARIKALIGIAAAPDFTEDLVWEKLTKTQREILQRDGEIFEEDAPPDHKGSRGCEPRATREDHRAVAPQRRMPMTLKLIEEARQHLILRRPFSLPCPLRLLQGKQDKEVPWGYAERIARHVAQPDTQVHVIEDGDHRLSTPSNLDLLWRIAGEFI